jgi:hypothetical protein
MSFLFSSRYLALATFALMLACSQRAGSVENGGPAVKLSENGICHAQGSSFYAATLHYQAFDTLEDCLKAGGRLPKASRHAKQPAAQEISRPAEPGIGRSPPPFLYLGLGAAALTAIGIFFTFKRIRSHRQRRPISVQKGISSIEQTLLNTCLGDSGVVERLIQYEVGRNPRLSRDRAAAAALGSIERDNR